MRGFPQIFIFDPETGNRVSVSHRVLRFTDREVVFSLPSLPEGDYQVFFDTASGRTQALDISIETIEDKLRSSNLPSALTKEWV
jgi:hypothetical protein